MTVQVATLGSKTWDWGLLLTGLPLCVATRAANIFPLSRLANLRRKLPLPHNLQVDTLPLISGHAPGRLSERRFPIWE